MRARFVFDQQNGDVTKSYYAELGLKGLHGALAVALFRASKRSNAAKKYRGRKFTRAAYDVKNWSLSEVCRILERMDKESSHDRRFAWGWKRDPNTPGYEWVLYVEITGIGQVSFHSADKLQGPDFAGEWDGKKLSVDRIIKFCDEVMGLGHTEPLVQNLDSPTVNLELPMQ